MYSSAQEGEGRIRQDLVRQRHTLEMQAPDPFKCCSAESVTECTLIRHCWNIAVRETCQRAFTNLDLLKWYWRLLPTVLDKLQCARILMFVPCKYLEPDLQMPTEYEISTTWGWVICSTHVDFACLSGNLRILESAVTGVWWVGLWSAGKTSSAMALLGMVINPQSSAPPTWCFRKLSPCLHLWKPWRR